MDSKTVIQQVASSSARKKFKPKPFYQWRRVARHTREEFLTQDFDTILSLQWPKGLRRIIKDFAEFDNLPASHVMTLQQYRAINAKLRRANLAFRLGFVDRETMEPFRHRLV